MEDRLRYWDMVKRNRQFGYVSDLYVEGDWDKIQESGKKDRMQCTLLLSGFDLGSFIAPVLVHKSGS